MERPRALSSFSDTPDRNAKDFYEGRYFVINMNMLRFTGLWPYQNKVTKLIVRIIFSTFIVIPGIPHLISAYVHKDNVELLIQGIGTFMYFISIGCKYFSMLIVEKKLKYLYKNMVENWKMLENQAEIDILKDSGEMGRLLTMGYLGYMISAVQAFVSLPLLPGTIMKVFPSFTFLNDSMLVLDGEYLVDRDKYYYYIYLFETLTCIMTVPMFSTIDSTYAVCVEQCIGLLKVVKLRLEVSTKQSTRFDSANARTEDLARDAIIKSAELHEKVLKSSNNYSFGRILESSYSTAFLFVMMTSTCTLVTISIGILFNLHRPLFLLRFLFLLMGFSMHVFFLSWPGQKMIDINNAVFYAAYVNDLAISITKNEEQIIQKNTLIWNGFAKVQIGYDNEWYECSVESQKLLKFIMRRTIKPFYLTCGGFYAMNFQNFEKIMKTAMSYITVLASFI